jgi:beta-lactamase superfamily II metal-dependent hydrolase
VRLWLLVLLVALTTRLPALTDRFYSNDEATYSALAARLNAGGSLYTDAVDHKPPGIASLYAAVFSAAGPYDLGAVRALLVVVVGATGIVVGELACVLTGDERSRMAGVLYALAAATGFPDNVQAANTELFLNLPLALAALAVHRATGSARTGVALACAIAGGALTGVAALFKYQSALAGGAWLYAAYAQRRRPAIAGAIAVGLAVGFAAIAAALLWHYYAIGGLDAFLFWGWRYNFTYIASMPIGRQLTRACVRTAVIALFWSPVIVLALRRPAGARDRSLAVAWALAMTIAVTTGGRYFGNYYLMVLPPLCVLAAWKPVPWRPLAAAGVLASVSVAAAAFWFTIKPDARYEDARYRILGRWLRDHSRPDDRPFVWGDAAQIYVYAERVMGTRFAFTNYHAGKIWGTGADEADAPARPDLEVPRAWRDLIDDVRRAPPAFIVDTGAAGLHGFGGHALDRYPAIWRIIQAKYRLAAEVEGVPVYQRTSGRNVTIYFIDVEGGQSTLIVGPSGGSLLVDAGYAGNGGRDASRIVAAAKDAGLSRIDNLLVTHFHGDHVGGVADLAARLPIGRFIDYGEPGADPNAAAPFQAYRAVRAAGGHLVPKPGDSIAFDGVDLRVVSAAGSFIDAPLEGAGAANPACADYRPHADDPSENARSLGVRVAFGRFRFLDLGDLNWNPLGRLVCPNDLLGRADLLLMPHHTSVDATVPAMLTALAPKVVVSNNGPTKGGSPEALALLNARSGVDLWQLHKALTPGTPNAAAERLANVDDGESGYWIKVVAREDGSFTVTNQRNGVLRAYR